jgi:chemotaxis receptor (MCP) glutamine deamidase CheD
MNKQEVELLSQEIEMLMAERARLLKVVGAAAVLVANADARLLQKNAVDAAEKLSELINALSEETLQDALESVNAQTMD